MVQVEVSEGILEGEEVQNEYGGTYYSFRGVPYAQPPLGDLRFKAPQPPRPWTGVRQATKFGPISYQCDLWISKENPVEMSEDSLYLNVYTPDIKPSKLLPVMVYIHGGGFVSGSGNDDFYGPEFLIRHGVLLVTLNYRLEALGFLCLDIADMPGNVGMKDQVAAFRWVKKNIGNFGGDPDNITIFGESSGACSVVYHLVSPMTKGLFRKAIAQSGSAVCWLGEDFQAREKALLLAKQLGCFSENDKEVYNFFSKQPVELLVNLKLQIWKAQKSYECPFTVADEKDFGQERFFSGNITDALRRGIHKGVDVMTGYTKDEGLLALSMQCAINDLMNEAKYFNEFLVPGWIKRHCVISDQLEVGRKMRQFYFGDGEVTKDKLLKFLGTDLIDYGVTLTAKFISGANKVYLYKFNCTTERNIFSRVDLPEPIEDDTLVCHGDDLAYMFPLKLFLGKVDEKSETYKAINRVLTLWTNFAKYGDPTPTPDDCLGVQWKPYTLQKQEYLDLDNTLKIDSVPDKEEHEFWNDIFKNYLQKYTIPK